MRIALILSLLLAIVAVIFALQNPAYVDVNLGPFQIRQSTALILMVTFCIGVLVGILATTPSIVKRRKRIRYLEKRAVDTTTEPAPAATEPPPAERDVHTSTSKEYRSE